MRPKPKGRSPLLLTGLILGNVGGLGFIISVFAVFVHMMDPIAPDLHRWVVVGFVSLAVMAIGLTMIFLKERFSLRRLLIAMTLIAVVLGFIVYAAK